MGNGTKDATAKSDIPPHVYAVITEFLIGAHVQELDLKVAHMRSSIKNIFPLILVMYSILIVTGVLSNLAVMVHIIRHKLYKDATYSFIINNVLSDIIKCVCVLPVSLYVLVIQNWMLGELLCSFLPMIQDIPIHVTTLTFVLIAWDRTRMIRNPNKPRLPAFVCAVGTWLTSFCLVLPYPIYIIYVDLGKYEASFDGVGICIVNLTDDMQEYMRGIFLVMYAAPMATISYLYVKSSRELQTSSMIIMYDTRHRESRSRADSHSTTTDLRSSRGECDGLSQYSRSSYREGRTRRNNSDAELDVPREKRTNKYLVTMVTMYAICLCPLMVLRVARLVLLETYDNTGHFDITYTIFVWLAFLPVCSTPAMYAAWQLSRPAKERLKGYFRFSNRRLRHSCEAVVATGPPRIQTAQHIVGRDYPLTHLEAHPDSSSYQQEFS